MNMNGNGALVVVDGVPLSSPMNNPGGSYGASSNSEGSVDYGNGHKPKSGGSANAMTIPTMTCRGRPTVT